MAAPQVVIMDGKPGAATARALATKAAHVDKGPMLFKAFVLEDYQENQDTKACRTVQRFCPCELLKQQAIEVSVWLRLVSGHADAIRPETMYSRAVDSCHGPATLNGCAASRMCFPQNVDRAFKLCMLFRQAMDATGFFGPYDPGLCLALEKF